MAIPTLLLSPSGSWDRAGAVSPSVSAGMAVAAGQYGPAWAPLEATTNLIPNPRMANDVSGWSRGGTGTSGRTLADGTAYATVTRGNTAAISLYSPVMPVTAGSTYTASASVRRFSGSPFAFIRIRWFSDTAGSVVISDSITTTFALTDAPQRAVLTADAPAGAIRASVYVLSSAGTVGEQFGVGFVQFEAKAWATPYADGSLGAGYSWAGTAHASASIRAGTALTVPVANHISPIQGEALVRVRKTDLTWFTATSTILRASDYPTPGDLDAITLDITSASGTTSARIRRNEVTTAQPLITPFPANQWAVVSLAWDATTVALRYHDGRVASVARTSPGRGLFNGSLLFVGSYNAAGAQNFNGLIEQILLFDRPLTATERATLFGWPAAWTWDVLLPTIGGLSRTRSPDPITASRSILDEPVALGRSVGVDPLALTRSVPTEPLALTRTYPEVTP